MSRSAGLERRVAAAAGEVLAREKAVTPVDVCVGLGWLHGRHVESWRYGRVGSLSEFLPVDDTRLTDFHDCLSRWAQATGLEPVEADYVSATRDRRPLLFTASAAPEAERAWRNRRIPAGLPAAARERAVQRQEKPPDLVVVMPVKDWQCAECGGTGDLLTMDSAGPLCMTCADLDHLVFLGAGDAALTRRAKKGSALSAVVVRWSRTASATSGRESWWRRPRSRRPSRRASPTRTPGYAAANGTVSAAPARTSTFRPGWRGRSTGCSRAARQSAPRPSPATPRYAAAAASAVRRPGARWTPKR
jgi:hypothetical protein